MVHFSIAEALYVLTGTGGHASGTVVGVVSFGSCYLIKRVVAVVHVLEEETSAGEVCFYVTEPAAVFVVGVGGFSAGKIIRLMQKICLHQPYILKIFRMF
ncbi:MAG: hypothetical protein PQJ50_01765 [Spirochaetales bacterium]|nr:hypothetical protein [Spirochaetales bacterium]